MAESKAEASVSDTVLKSSAFSRPFEVSENLARAATQ